MGMEQCHSSRRGSWSSWDEALGMLLGPGTSERLHPT